MIGCDAKHNSELKCNKHEKGKTCYKWISIKNDTIRVQIFDGRIYDAQIDPILVSDILYISTNKTPINEAFFYANYSAYLDPSMQVPDSLFPNQHLILLTNKDNPNAYIELKSVKILYYLYEIIDQ